MGLKCRAATLVLAVILLAVGVTPVAARPGATPRCFGAAARDPRRPCENPRLRLRVTPSVPMATLTPNLACVAEQLSVVLSDCAYGVPASAARGTVALLGDSHAAHWRAAMDYVAWKEGWRVQEIARPHCPFSFASPAVSEAEASSCVAWNHEIVSWLQQTPSISTLVVSAAALLPMARTPGVTEHATRVAGFLGAWSALPSSVTRVIVLRDPPSELVTTHDCVQRAQRRRRPPGRACAIPRHRALPSDAEVAAARRLHAHGASVVDLSAHFCDARRCFPVVGGVLVHKDTNHLTQLFARTLGPYLLRDIRAILSRRS
jgi:hypothetical protein